MKPTVITKELANPGVRVVRGPDWCWDNQDGGAGSTGTIIPDSSPMQGWVRVKWDISGAVHNYRTGPRGNYDLALYNPFVQTALEPKGNYRPPRVQEMRQAMESSIKKSDSLIEKSNKNYEHNTDSTGSAIKVRRPVIKIQGAKR